MIYQIVDLVLAITVLFWLSWDMTRRKVQSKYRWGWLISLVIAFFFLHLFGVIGVMVAYYVWIKFIRTEQSV